MLSINDSGVEGELVDRALREGKISVAPSKQIPSPSKDLRPAIAIRPGGDEVPKLRSTAREWSWRVVIVIRFEFSICHRHSATKSFVSESDHWIDLRCAPRGYPTSEKS